MKSFVRLNLILGLALLAVCLLPGCKPSKEPDEKSSAEIRIVLKGTAVTPLSGTTNSQEQVRNLLANVVSNATVEIHVGELVTNVPAAQAQTVLASLWPTNAVASVPSIPISEIVSSNQATVATLTPTPPKEPVTITVLCYHQFNRPRNPYSVSGEEFRRQMQKLKDDGYQVIPMSSALAFLQGKKDSLPAKSVVITIDDGFRSVYDVAYPILKEFDYPWVFYVYTDFVNSGTGAVTWEQLREMMNHKMEIGSHSKSHPLLTKKGRRSDDEYRKWLEEEIVLSKKIIEDNLGVPVQTFAYPYGGHNDSIRKLTVEAGYEGIVNVLAANNFSGSDRHNLNRFVVTKDLTFDKAMNLVRSNGALMLTGATPEQGAVVDSARPVVSAVIAPGQDIDPATVSLTFRRKVKGTVEYDKVTGVVKFTPVENFPFGANFLTVRARKTGGGQWLEGAWFFHANTAGIPSETDYSQSQEKVEASAMHEKKR